MKLIENQTYDVERALYNLCDTQVKSCVFAGPADGESVLKETRNILVDNCSFSLRYPVWHAKNYSIKNSKMDDKTRAAIWYCDDGVIENSSLYGVKAVRECNRTKIRNCDIVSPEFGWKTNQTKIENSSLVSEYVFFDSNDITVKGLDFKGKYSFQYTNNVVIENSNLDTKDAFWHSKNVTVKNSVVKGEYLAWFSDGLTLINCKIIGTQPLCYCKNLTLIDCEMTDCDLSFEYSDVSATVKGHIDSVKNPHSGKIVADTIGEIILEDSIMENKAEILTRQSEKSNSN